MAFLIAALKIIFLLGFLILIHEAGHLMIAKLCKVKVNEFAIGFGPTVWKKQGKETMYALRLIPLGGFCSMEGEDEKSEDERSFSKASIPKRIAIVIAGATVNIIFGIVVYFILMSTTSTYVTNKIDSTIENYAAAEIELQQNDEIIELDGKKIKNKYDIDKALANVSGKETLIKVKRNDEILEFKIILTEVNHKNTGIYLDDKCNIISVIKNSAAFRQGFKKNDKILKINGIETNSNSNEFIKYLQENNFDSMILTVLRNKEEIDIKLTPDLEPKYYLGVDLFPAEDTLINHLIYAGIETKKFTFSIIENLKNIFTRGIELDSMVGPVGISQIVAKTNGFREFIYYLALISLSLGVTNLLPIPALDGGKILILLIEAIRRKQMKQETEITIQMIGFSILIAISLYVTYNDILRIF